MIAHVAQRVALARSIAVLSGAGMSAESGIPTFRSGAEAVWRHYRPEELATPQAFARDPMLVWEWYGERLARLAACGPNPGHIALARLQTMVPALRVITQNVDGLHAAAGSTGVIELHGNIRRARCVAGCGTVPVTVRAVREAADRRDAPHCACGALLRPDVVWFGEHLPDDALALAQDVTRAADVFIVAGTSAVVYPAAGFVGMAKQAGAFVVEVNPEPTDVSALCDVNVRSTTGAFFPALMDALSDPAVSSAGG